jgi:hypothetical protein
MKRTLIALILVTAILVPTSSRASDGIIYGESIPAGKSGAMLAEEGETIRLAPEDKIVALLDLSLGDGKCTSCREDTERSRRTCALQDRRSV